MLEYFTYSVFILTAGMAATGIMFSAQIRKEYPGNFSSALIYLQVFVFAFGFYGMWGQVVIDKFISGYLPEDLRDRTSTIQALLGFPFMILSWYMLIRLANSLKGSRLSRVFTLSFFSIHAASLFVIGYYAFSKTGNPLDLYIYYYIGFGLISHLSTTLILLFKPAKNSRIKRSKLNYLALVIILGCLLQSLILLIFNIEEYYALVFVFIFFISYSAIPLVIRYSGILPTIIRPVGESLSYEKFCEKYEISQRERDVIAEMCKGLTNKEIADKLFISLQTVKDHTHRIYIKTGLRNRIELVNSIRKLPS